MEDARYTPDRIATYSRGEIEVHLRERREQQERVRRDLARLDRSNVHEPETRDALRNEAEYLHGVIARLVAAYGRATASRITPTELLASLHSIEGVTGAAIIGTGGDCEGLQINLAGGRILFATDGDAGLPTVDPDDETKYLDGWRFFGLFADAEAFDTWEPWDETRHEGHLRDEDTGLDDDRLIEGVRIIAADTRGRSLELPGVYTVPAADFDDYDEAAHRRASLPVVEQESASPADLDEPDALAAPVRIYRTTAVPAHGGLITLQMDEDAYRALAVAVEIAFDDRGSVPTEYQQAADALWTFFHAGRS